MTLPHGKFAAKWPNYHPRRSPASVVRDEEWLTCNQRNDIGGGFRVFRRCSFVSYALSLFLIVISSIRFILFISCFTHSVRFVGLAYLTIDFLFVSSILLLIRGISPLSYSWTNGFIIIIVMFFHRIVFWSRLWETWQLQKVKLRQTHDSVSGYFFSLFLWPSVGKGNIIASLYHRNTLIWRNFYGLQSFFFRIGW